MTASERYNTRLEALLVDRLGVQFADRQDSDPTKRAVREIVGVDGALPRRWSARRAAIDLRRAVLAGQFQADHSRPPTPKEAVSLAEQANLQTRQAKHEPRSYAEQRATWRAEALAVLGGEIGLRDFVRRALSPAAVDAVATFLASPKTRLRTRVAAEAAATDALTAAGADRWVGFTVTETADVAYRQERRGRPGDQTRYRRTQKPVFTIAAAVRADNVAYDAVTDGCFPLITNDTVMTPAQVLAAYRYQPNLERRNHLLKGPQQVAPVYLETAHRIEALLLCHFLAMLTEALIEREIRNTMKTEGLTGIALYPELRNCPAPSAPRILEIFNDLQRHHLIAADHIVQTFQPELSPLQQQVLDLLHIPASVYTSTETP